MSKEIMLQVIMLMLMTSCTPADKQDAGSEARHLSDLPRIKQNGIDYPYIRYRESSGKTESRGRTFFLYPIKRVKNEILALEYAPGMRIKDLFSEDLLGTGGFVARNARHIRVDFLPISIPIGVSAGQEWRMLYAKREFMCKSRTDQSRGTAGQFSISCITDKYELSYQFQRDLGVTEFQDFCGYSICTFKLEDSQGLLSKSMTDLMDLPQI